MVAQNIFWINPFSANRIEDWRVEEHPENYKMIVSLFAPPDFMNKLEDPSITKAIFISGGRGCGKSHILRRMAIQSEIKALEARFERKLTKTDFEKKYFGIYIKTDCFSPLSKENIKILTDEQLEVLFEHLFNVEVSKSIVEAIRFIITYFANISPECETKICEKIKNYLKWNCYSITSFSELLNCLDNEATQIAQLTKYVLFDNNYFEKNIKTIHLSQTPDFILKFYEICRSEFELLNNIPLVLLLDEYESLDENQQKIINQIIKSRRLTLRIAVKVRGFKTVKTKTNQVLDEIHDYEAIDLHFASDHKLYKALLERIFKNRLNLKGEYGEYQEKDPYKLLPAPTMGDEGISNEEVDKELRKIKASLNKKKETKNPEYWSNFKGHYREAAIYRVLRNKGKDKLYAGFEKYVSLSSGIVRLFIWLCREAFELAHQEEIDIRNGSPINAKLQTLAATNVSKNEINITIPQTISNSYASKLALFVFDIGQILRAKLYYSTQPQANRIELIDPEKLESDEYKIPRDLIASGEDLPILLTESSFKPRDVAYPFPKTFALNRIFAPLLNVPLEERWRTEINAAELKSLCLSESRSATLKSIITQIKGKRRSVRDSYSEIEMPDLLSRQKPVTLENCVITGKGCNRDLLAYESSSAQVKAFLAIPFSKGWISDPRQWIKDIMLENSVECLDIDDFPALNHFLCKYCSCVRQYPFGIFEITELNSNVIFEFGMAVGLNKTCFLMVHKNKILSRYKNENFPPNPLGGIEYISYELSSSAIASEIQKRILPVILELQKSQSEKCKVLDSPCPHQNTLVDAKKLFVGLPEEPFFDEVYKVIENVSKALKYTLIRHSPAKSKNQLCQICLNIKASSFCIIDTTHNDISMLFALGVAFGKDKKYIQLHNIELGNSRPISDLRSWACEYKNLTELSDFLSNELPKRIGEL